MLDRGDNSTDIHELALERPQQPHWRERYQRLLASPLYTPYGDGSGCWKRIVADDPEDDDEADPHAQPQLLGMLLLAATDPERTRKDYKEWRATELHVESLWRGDAGVAFARDQLLSVYLERTIAPDEASAHLSFLKNDVHGMPGLYAASKCLWQDRHGALRPNYETADQLLGILADDIDAAETRTRLMKLREDFYDNERDLWQGGVGEASIWDPSYPLDAQFCSVLVQMRFDPAGARHRLDAVRRQYFDPAADRWVSSEEDPRGVYGTLELLALITEMELEKHEPSFSGAAAAIPSLLDIN